VKHPCSNTVSLPCFFFSFFQGFDLFLFVHIFFKKSEWVTEGRSFFGCANYVGMSKFHLNASTLLVHKKILNKNGKTDKII